MNIPKSDLDESEAQAVSNENPARRRKFNLDEILDSINEDNLHPAFDWGPPVGRERFWEDEENPHIETNPE